MWLVVFGLSLSLAMVLADLPARAESPSVRAVGVRVGSYAQATRFVIDLTGPVPYRISRVAKPYRVIVEMPPVDWRISSNYPMRRGGLIKSFRFGAFTPGKNRIVLVTRKPVRIARHFVLRPTKHIRVFRLVLDLKETTAKEFMAAARKTSAIPKRRPAGPRATKPKARAKGAKPVIVIDAGHGGIDRGATGAAGTREKSITLQVAKALRKTLLASGKYKVVLTRETDIFIRLRDRIAIARKAGGDVFISLHADALNLKWFRGASVYTLSEKASDDEAAALAKKENKADIIAGVDLSGESGEVRNILIDLAQRETMNRSVHLAKYLIKELRAEIKLVRSRTHRFAGFAVLRAPDIPSVLVELGYLSNPADERLLRSPRHHARLARAITKAIDRYIALKTKLSRS